MVQVLQTFVLFINQNQVNIKKITKFLGVLTFTLFLGFSTPVVAQTTGDNTGTTATAGDNNDDTGKWGLAG